MVMLQEQNASIQPMVEEEKNLDGLFSDFWDKEDYTKHALFLDELPTNIENDPTLAALSSMTEEELRSAEDSIKHWKAVGNDHYLEGATMRLRYRDAIEAYTKALEVEEGESFRRIRAQVFSNRANCYYKVKDYVKCVEDGKRAVQQDAKCIKGYFHCARGSRELGLIRRAFEYCEKGVESVGSESAVALVEMAAELKARIVAREKREREATAQYRQAEVERIHGLETALAQREITHYVSRSRYDAPGCGEPIYDKELDAIVWSLLILIEDYNVAESAPEVAEQARILDVLQAMFPIAGPYPDWDKHRLYEYPNLEVCIDCPDSPGELKPISVETTVAGLVKMLPRIEKFPVITLRWKKSKTR